jgi:hypothetical protein
VQGMKEIASRFPSSSSDYSDELGDTLRYR